MTHVYSQSNFPPSKSPNLKWKEKLGAYLLARTTAYQTKVKENNPILLTPPISVQEQTQVSEPL